MSQNDWATIMPFGPVTLIFYWPQIFFSGQPMASPHFRHWSGHVHVCLVCRFCLFLRFFYLILELFRLFCSLFYYLRINLIRKCENNYLINGVRPIIRQSDSPIVRRSDSPIVRQSNSSTNALFL